MGGSSQASYPAPVLAGLWTGTNTQFGPTQPTTTYTTPANAGAYLNTANTLSPAGTAIGSSGQSLLPYVNQALQTGFDPQNALYQKSFQQNQDQTRAANAAAGVANTPYGAGLEANSDQNFNIAWQNAQLGRQQTAAGTAGSLLGSASGAQGINQQVIQDYLNYVNMGINAASAWDAAVNQNYAAATGQYGTQVQSQTAANQQSGAALGGLGSLLGTLGGFGIASLL